MKKPPLTPISEPRRVATVEVFSRSATLPPSLAPIVPAKRVGSTTATWMFSPSGRCLPSYPVQSTAVRKPAATTAVLVVPASACVAYRPTRTCQPIVPRGVSE